MVGLLVFFTKIISMNPADEITKAVRRQTGSGYIPTPPPFFRYLKNKKYRDIIQNNMSCFPFATLHKQVGKVNSTESR